MVRALGTRWRWPHKKRGISLDVDSVKSAVVVLDAVVESPGGRNMGYRMELRRYGGDKWLVGYFDTTIGPIVPLLCDYPPPPRVN